MGLGGKVVGVEIQHTKPGSDSRRQRLAAKAAALRAAKKAAKKRAKVS